MSALSAFMVAYKQASDPLRSPKLTPISQEDGADRPSGDDVERTQQGDYAESVLTHSDNFSGHQDWGTGVPLDREATSLPSNSHIAKTPRLHNADSSSLDSLFSDGESYQDYSVDGTHAPNGSKNFIDDDDNNDSDDSTDSTDSSNTNNREPTWASDGEFFTTQPVSRPGSSFASVSRHAPFGVRRPSSPQISPKTVYRAPLVNPFLHPSQDHSSDTGLSGPESKDDHIASLGKAAPHHTFGQPAFTIQQQHYAWHSAHPGFSQPDLGVDDKSAKYEGDPPASVKSDGEAGHDSSKQGSNNQGARYRDGNDSIIEDEEESESTTSSEESQAEMEASGFTNGVPFSADIDRQRGTLQLKPKSDMRSSRKEEAAHGRRRDNDFLALPSAMLASADVTLVPECPDSNRGGPGSGKIMSSAKVSRQSGFNEALQALQQDEPGSTTQEMQASDIHLQRLQAVCEQYKSTNKMISRDHAEDTQPRAVNLAAERERECSPSPEDAQGGDCRPMSLGGDLVENELDLHSSKPCAGKSPNPDTKMYYVSYPSKDDEEERNYPLWSSKNKIPGLVYLNDQGVPKDEAVAAIAERPPVTSAYKQETHSDMGLETDIRTSIEPETPRHLLIRDCTPAFEDRSPTPSPKTLSPLDAERDDVGMEDVSYRHELKDVAITDLNNTTLVESITITSTKATMTKTRPISSNSNQPRRKSAVRGTGVKIEKPKSTVKPSARNASRKTAVAETISDSTSFTAPATTAEIATTIDPAAAAEAAITATEKQKKEGGKAKGKVKEAVQRIQGNIDDEARTDHLSDDAQGRETGGGGGGGRKKTKRKSGLNTKTLTPPTRRSRRLMEKRGDTPEIETNGGGSSVTGK